MPETESRHEGLDNKGVSVRAAATRDLARDGGVADVPVLLEMVGEDKSPSVRLYAAAAAAEILMRHRGAYDQVPLAGAERASLLAAVSRIDPASCPSIALCYSAFPSTDCIKRLVRMLRDPRVGVRLGAAAAIRRMALSGAATNEGPNLREWVGDALDHPKLPVDAQIEMVKLVGEAGWFVLRPRVVKAEARGGQLAEAAGVALERLAGRENPATWAGVWVDESRDVQQLKDPELCDCRVLDSVEISEGQVAFEGLGLARLIYAPRLAEEGSFCALQVAGRTWWKLEGKALVRFVEADDNLADYRAYAPLLAAELEAVSGAAALRARALLWLRCGEPAKALEVLETPLSAKKPRNDLFFLQGAALLAMGETTSGKKALSKYLERAKTKDPWKAEAEALTK